MSATTPPAPPTDPVFEEHTFAPDPNTVFKPIVSAFEVEYAIAQCVRVWIRDYLAEAERQRGLPVGQLPWFRSIVPGADASKWPEDQLPALIVVSAGTDPGPGGRLEVHADGGYVQRWRVDCVCEVSARGNRQAQYLARVYAAHVGAMLVQQALRAPGPLEGGVVSLRKLDKIGERYDLRDWTVDRTRCAGVVHLQVEVADVLHGAPWGPRVPRYEPTDPTVDPPPEMLAPIVQTADVDVDKQDAS